MMITARIGMAGFLLGSILTLSGCSDSSMGDESLLVNDDAQASADGQGTLIPTTETGEVSSQDDATGAGSGSDSGTSSGGVAGNDTSTATDTVATSGSGTDTVTESTDSTDSTDPTDPTDSTSSTDSGTGNPPADDSQPVVELSPPSVTGSDLSGGDDDSPTATETASLAGAFIKDTSRPAGPPSVPSGLTLLLAAEDWIEFTWVPSHDDQSVEAYEIYRDGVLIATVRGDTGYEHDLRSWLSTSFIDCNYTRYTDCDEEAGRKPAPGASYAYSVAAVDNEGMKSAQSAPVTFTFEQLQGSTPPDVSTYTQVFDEEFNGPVLDRSRWKTSLPWGPDQAINGESQYFVNTFGANPPDYDPFVFTGETLQITGKKTPADILSQVNNQPYLSGVISTSDYFEMTYGYVEMSARLAGGQGLLSTFYLFNQDFYKNKPEIDIIEYIGSRPDKAYQTYHYFDSNRARDYRGEKHSSPTMETLRNENLSAGFHKYSVLWEPGLVIWYLDGEEVRRMTGPRVSDEPMNIIAHLVVGSDWIGAPDTAAIPATFEIDYIKAWQKQ